jgi:hypothetical protein
MDIGPDELIEWGSPDHLAVRDQMQVLAKRIAAERQLPSADYRDVASELKKNQAGPIAILPLY